MTAAWQFKPLFASFQSACMPEIPSPESILESLSPEAREVVLNALRSKEAHLEYRDGIWWYCDPYFGDDTRLERLTYSPELGLLAGAG